MREILAVAQHKVRVKLFRNAEVGARPPRAPSSHYIADKSIFTKENYLAYSITRVSRMMFTLISRDI